jgi:putative hydrolase of the HAD superfamily
VAARGTEVLRTIVVMTASSNGVGLVCFDLGGVLLRICRTWAEGCDAAGVELRGDIDALHARDNGLHELADLHQTGRIDLPSYAERFSELVDRLYDTDEIMRVHAAWILGEYAGLDRLVERLEHAHVDTAILSNTNHEHWSTLPRYPILERIRHRYASHELGLRKPDEAIYRAIEERTGHCGKAIVFFDDLTENVEAARAVGWRAHQIDPHGSPPQQMMRVLAVLGVLD